MVGVGAYQQFINVTSGATGTVNTALNGTSLRDPQTLVLGGNPLDENTLIEGNGFDLLLGTVSALNNFRIGFTGSIEFDSILFGGEINQTLSPTQYLLKGLDANNDTSIQLDKNNILINSSDVALSQNSFKGINPNVFLERVTDNFNFGETRLNSSKYKQEIHDSITNEVSSISLTPIDIITELDSPLTFDSYTLINTSSNSKARFLDNADISFIEFQTGKEETNFDLVSLGLNYSKVFDATNDTFDLNFKDTKRGVHFNSNIDWIIEFFENTDTKSSKLELNPNDALLRFGDLGTSIFNKVNANLTDVFLESDYNTFKSILTVTGGLAGFAEIQTDSNLGIREAFDYSANYVPTSLVNQNYSDSNVNGLNVTNTPSLAGDVLAYNGIDLTWQPQSGGGGGGLALFSNMSISLIDSGGTSNNDVKYIKFLCPADIDITTLGAFITSVGGDMITLGVYDLGNNLLVQANLIAGGTGVKSTAAFPAVTMNGGQRYWLALKGNLASTNYGKRPCLNDQDISQSQFFGGAGLPNPKGGFSNNESPYIEIRA